MSESSASNRALLSSHLTDATARKLVDLVGTTAQPDEIAKTVAEAARARIAELEGTATDAEALVD